ncbi:MAG: hypothetical protein IJW97_03085, partial [Clostridia bacterium]|nr:hypothetical protein [Clostridia bacterium]
PEMVLAPAKNHKLHIRAERGSNRSKFPPSKTKKSLLPTFVSFSLFAVLFEAAKARLVLSDNRVRISRRGATALARDAAGIHKGCNPL